MTKKDGKPCKKCGSNDWYKSGHCKQCKNEQSRRWARENPDRQREISRRWRENNREKERERCRRWRENNPEKYRESYTKWQEQNPEKRERAVRRWRANNPDKVREMDRRACRRWRKNNPEKKRAQWHRRLGRIKGNGGSYTEAEWREVVRQQDGRCLACGKKCKLTIDHVLPISMGGTSDISNIQGLCFSCNASKRDKHVDYRTGGKGIRRWIQRKLL